MKRRTRSIKRYARHLFGAVSIDDIKVIIGELSSIDRLIMEDQTIKRVLLSYTFEREDKELALNSIAEGMGLSHHTRAFLELLIKDNRVYLLPKILIVLASLYDKAMNIARVEVTSAVELDPSIKDRIRDMLIQSLNRDVIIHYKVDPEIIGGLIFLIGSLMIDHSLKGQLTIMKQRFLEG